MTGVWGSSSPMKFGSKEVPFPAFCGVLSGYFPAPTWDVNTINYINYSTVNTVTKYNWVWLVTRGRTRHLAATLPLLDSQSAAAPLPFYSKFTPIKLHFILFHTWQNKSHEVIIRRVFFHWNVHTRHEHDETRRRKAQRFENSKTISITYFL